MWPFQPLGWPVCFMKSWRALEERWISAERSRRAAAWRDRMRNREASQRFMDVIVAFISGLIQDLNHHREVTVPSVAAEAIGSPLSDRRYRDTVRSSASRNRCASSPLDIQSKAGDGHRRPGLDPCRRRFRVIR